MKKTLMLAAIAVLGAAASATAASFTLQQSAVSGQPGDTVGWGFSITNLTDWIVISHVEFVPDAGVYPVGVFTPFITNTFTVIGPDAGNGEIETWTQTFDGQLLMGAGSYHINSFQSPGDLTTGNIVLLYDEFSVSPLDPVFDPFADTLRTGLSMSAAASVDVSSPVAVPEPSPMVLFAAALLLTVPSWRMNARRRAKVLGGMVMFAVLHGVAHADIAQVASFPVTNGQAVATDNQTLIVGAPGSDVIPPQVLVFVRSGTAWGQQALIPMPANAIGPASAVRFGSKLALSGDTLAIGGCGDNAYNGAVWVFARSDGFWAEQAKLTIMSPPNGSCTFGESVALDGNTLLAGSPGFVSVFTRSGSTWSQQATLSGPDIFYGQAVALLGRTALIGGNGRADVWSGSGRNWLQAPSIINTSAGFGSSVALGNGIAAVGAPDAALVYLYTPTPSSPLWTQTAQLTVPNLPANSLFGSSIALSGDSVLVGAPEPVSLGPSNLPPGSAYLFTRLGNTWTPAPVLIPSNSHRDDHFGYAVDLAGDTASVVSFSSLSSGGAAFIFTVQNATLLSNPSGRGFSISGCGVNGNFTTPFTGFLANCTITWNSPDTTIPHTRYTFQNWADGEASNPRAFSLPIESINYTFTANFLTEYELTAQSSPVSGGSVSGAGWYTAGTTAGVAAIPNPGFTFAGFTGGLTGAVNPQGIAMNGPQNATGSFAATPPAALSAVVSAKSGAANGRLWTISLTNGGPGTAYTAQLFLLQFTQTFGTACTTLPVRLSPAALPAALGTLANGATAQAAVALDFTGCPANARFAVNLGYMCNGGASGGIIQLVNQLP